MEIIIDTREQKPYVEFFERFAIPYQRKTLITGDYTIKGFENSFSLERKTLHDFIQSITTNRERFEKELQRAKNLRYFAIIIEGSYYDISNKNYHADVEPKSVLSTIFSWSVRYNIPIFLVDSREGGALAVIKLAEFYLKDVNQQE